MKRSSQNRIHAPELYGDHWINSDPLTLQDMARTVILLAFWDYASSSSLAVIPYLREWHRRYADMGLMIVGVHTPEFSFAQDRAEVESAVRRLGLQFPIVTDNSRHIWDQYRVQELPTLVLVDRDGDIYHVQSGEGGYDHAERAIQFLLREAGNRGELPLLLDFLIPHADTPDSYLRPTPSMRTGYLHGALGNIEGYSPELPAGYTDLGYQIEGKFYADGEWIARPNAIEFCGTGEGHLALRYVGRSVNAVMGSTQAGAGMAVLHDGRPVDQREFGRDITKTNAGDTLVLIDRPNVFNLIALPAMEEHLLVLKPLVAGISIYAFTFGAPPVSFAGPQTQDPIWNN
jgi:peroxiredoxin